MRPPTEPLTLRVTAERIRQGEDAWICIREMLDAYYAADRTSRRELLRERPEPVGEPRFDAYLAALAEHLALHDELSVPIWTRESGRFLEQWWFPTSIKALHATALVQSPAAFRRRGIFVDDTELLRV